MFVMSGKGASDGKAAGKGAKGHAKPCGARNKTASAEQGEKKNSTPPPSPPDDREVVQLTGETRMERRKQRSILRMQSRVAEAARLEAEAKREAVLNRRPFNIFGTKNVDGSNATDSSTVTSTAGDGPDQDWTQWQKSGGVWADTVDDNNKNAGTAASTSSGDGQPVVKAKRSSWPAPTITCVGRNSPPREIPPPIKESDEEMKEEPSPSEASPEDEQPDEPAEPEPAVLLTAKSKAPPPPPADSLFFGQRLPEQTVQPKPLPPMSPPRTTLEVTVPAPPPVTVPAPRPVTVAAPLWPNIPLEWKLPPPPKWCNRNAGLYGSPMNPCECNLWTQWIDANEKRVRFLEEYQLSSGTVYANQPDHHPAYYRQGGGSRYWWHAGNLLRIIDVLMDGADGRRGHAVVFEIN